MPDGSTITSTHKAVIPIPGLSLKSRTAHIFPALGNTSLISIGQLCDAGCEVLFDKETATVWYQGKIVMTGTRSPTTRLWTTTLTPPEPTPAVAYYATSSATPAERVAFMHAALFSPALSTLQKALDNNYITDFPGLTAAALKKHPPHSTATFKGHLDQTRKNQRSTKRKPKGFQEHIDSTNMMEDYFPPREPLGLRSHDVYADVINMAEDKANGHTYSDQTGKFPIPSSRGNNYCFVLYDYDSNAIDAVAIKNRTATSIRDAYNTVNDRLKRAGLKPRLHILDNECSALLKDLFYKEGIHYQLVPPGIHRRNAAERAIRTFKNHLIAGICSTDPDFPLHLWDLLLPQCLLTLNLMRGSRINPKLSAWAQVHGPYRYNSTPIAPPGIKVLAHVKSQIRGTWAAHALDGWYLAPAMESYRCYKIWITETRGTRIIDTVTWFPHHVTMPIASSTDIVIAAANDLLTALANPSPDSPLSPLADSEVATLRTLSQVLLNRQEQPAPAPTAEPSPSPVPTPTPMSEPIPTPVASPPAPAAPAPTAASTAPQSQQLPQLPPNPVLPLQMLSRHPPGTPKPGPPEAPAPPGPLCHL
jgi:hypothetical protein